MKSNFIGKMTNSDLSCRGIYDYIMHQGVRPVFDLDDVLFCSKHRAKVVDGVFDLGYWRENSVPEKIIKDEPLMMLNLVNWLNDSHVKYDVCTARVMSDGDLQLLEKWGVYPAKIYSRDGEHDNRSDCDLKFNKLKDTGKRMLLLDDKEANCKSVARLDHVKSIQII